MKEKNSFIFPDEIFLDSKNSPSFNVEQFEGQIEKPIKRGIFIGASVIFILILFIFSVRLFNLQIVRGEYFRERSEKNSLRAEIIFPDRGVVYDRFGIPLVWNDDTKRVYTERNGFSHILGYIGLPNEKEITRPDIVSPEMKIGKNGIEQSYSSILSGSPGTKLTERDSLGGVVSESFSNEAKHGKKIGLTIDAELQSEVYRAIKSVVDERGFTGGAGIIMDVKNGELLSLVSVPEYDSQVMSLGQPADKIKSLLEDKRKVFLNRAISGIYEPGSTIKPLVAVGALNEKIIAPEKGIFSSGSISIPNPFRPGEKTVFKDWKAHGWVDIKHALAVSSNVYFYEVGGGFEEQAGLGIKKIKDYATLFGFNEETGVDIPGESVGVIPSPEEKAKSEPNDPIWRIGDTYHTSIGQGLFRTTPIRMAVYASAIANYGKILKPHVFLSEEDKKNPDEKYFVRDVEIPKNIFNTIHDGMRLAVLEGTAKALDLPGVEIAAKTGTAQLGVAKASVNSWIIGFFPYKEPKYAFTIVLEKGSSSNLVGALYASSQIMNWMTIYRPQYLRP